jgi:hypothetical protein
MRWRSKTKKNSNLQKTPVRVFDRRSKPVVPRRLKRLEQDQQVIQHFFWSALFRWGRVILLSAFFCGSVGYAFLMSPLTETDRVDIEGGDAVSQEQFRASLDALLDQPVGLWFSHRNFFLFPKEAVFALVREKFPHIQSIEIEKRFPQTVKLRIVTRDQFVILCSNGPCFTLDERGFIVSNEDALDDSWQRIRVIDQSGFPLDMTHQLLSPEFMMFLEQLPSRLRSEAGISLSGDWETPSRFSGTIDVMTTEGWKLRLDSQTADDATLAALRLFFTKQVTSQADRLRLEYVDSRTKDRIYYRFHGDESMSTTTAPVQAQSVPTPSSDQKSTTKK